MLGLALQAPVSHFPTGGGRDKPPLRRLLPALRPSREAVGVSQGLSSGPGSWLQAANSFQRAPSSTQGRLSVLQGAWDLACPLGAPAAGTASLGSQAWAAVKAGHCRQLSRPLRNCGAAPPGKSGRLPSRSQWEGQVGPESSSLLCHPCGPSQGLPRAGVRKRQGTWAWEWRVAFRPFRRWGTQGSSGGLPPKPCLMQGVPAEPDSGTGWLGCCQMSIGGWGGGGGAQPAASG